MKLKQKSHFDFKNNNIKTNVGKIYLKQTYTNIFLTFTDMKDKIIICKTSGIAGIKGSKRQKKVPQAIESILKCIKPYLKLYKIDNIEIVLKMKLIFIFII